MIGHMGEMLPMMLARADEVFSLDVDHLSRPISRAILDQVWLTTSGIFTEPPFLAALKDLRHRPHHVLGRLSLCAQRTAAASFLYRLSLSPTDMAKLCHGNADRLLKLKAE